ncbi:MAG TPA: RES family NAD+ phosphorylase [Novosphingobium sp.]|nr:RES family NAD+ phosphorylase [Novosphingobium sp.]
MKLWRLTRAPFVALDGVGAALNGARYASPGRPVVSLASEAGLAVLVALRYQPRDLQGIPDDFVLGWTEVDATPERVPGADGEDVIRAWVGEWLDSKRSLLAAVSSRVLPEADVVLLNPAHPDAAAVPPLTTRRFSFAECLHEPPMLASYGTSK